MVSLIIWLILAKNLTERNERQLIKPPGEICCTGIAELINAVTHAHRRTKPLPVRRCQIQFRGCPHATGGGVRVRKRELEHVGANDLHAADERRRQPPELRHAFDQPAGRIVLSADRRAPPPEVKGRPERKFDCSVFCANWGSLTKRRSIRWAAALTVAWSTPPAKAFKLRLHSLRPGYQARFRRNRRKFGNR